MLAGSSFQALTTLQITLHIYKHCIVRSGICRIVVFEKKFDVEPLFHIQIYKNYLCTVGKVK